jgi:hypothetical protein
MRRTLREKVGRTGKMSDCAVARCLHCALCPALYRAHIGMLVDILAHRIAMHGKNWPNRPLDVFLAVLVVHEKCLNQASGNFTSGVRVCFAGCQRLQVCGTHVDHVIGHVGNVVSVYGRGMQECHVG